MPRFAGAQHGGNMKELPTTPPGDFVWGITESRLQDLLRAKKDLLRARALIGRLRAENKALRKQSSIVFEAVAQLRDRDIIRCSVQRMFGVVLALNTIRKNQI